MLELIIDFLQEDGMVSEVWGNIPAAEILEKAIEFYTMNNFRISDKMTAYGKNTFANKTLMKPDFSKFFNVHEVERITKAEYDAYC
jgi:hypothetical protein